MGALASPSLRSLRAFPGPASRDPSRPRSLAAPSPGHGPTRAASRPRAVSCRGRQHPGEATSALPRAGGQLRAVELREPGAWREQRSSRGGGGGGQGGGGGRGGRESLSVARASPQQQGDGAAQATQKEVATPDSAPAPLGASGAAGAGAGAGVGAAAVAVATGEDAAVFSALDQSLAAWGAFFAVLGTVLGLLWLLWLDPTTGWGTPFADFFRELSPRPEVQMALMLLVFAVVHSGGAALRPQAEELIGARAYRVLFAGTSLPLAVSAVVFFINHRYDGTVLWQLRGVPGMHEAVWAMSLVSFLFLYPSTFNLLEVAAVDTPRLHLWGSGIARITRHPQMWGQLLWCVAHMLWVGSSFTAITSLVLCLHHAFGVWHGEQRLARKYGDRFKEVQAHTSIVPFAAILEGRQKLPPDYYKEFLRLPYLGVVGTALGAYLVHPLMIRASFWLHW